MTLQRPNAEYRRKKIDTELQADPELQEGPASGSRIALYAAAIAVVLGAVFYGLSNGPTGTGTTAQAPATAPAANTADKSRTSPPNIRDVTPNRDPGATTGAAPAQSTQPQANPTGTEVDRSKGPVTR